MRVDLTCTDPEQWTLVPPSDAPNEVIDRYLAHVDNCPFHAALEQSETDDLQRIVEAARSLSPSGELPLTIDEESRVTENLERYIDFLNGKKKITMVRLQGTGLDDKVLNVANRKERISFNVPAPCALQVLATVEDGGQDLLIATHVINPISHKKLAPLSSQLSLGRNQSLHFETRPLGGNWFQVAVSASKLHWVPLIEKLRFNALRSWPGKPITRRIGITEAAFVAVLSILLLAMFFHSWRSETITDNSPIHSGQENSNSVIADDKSVETVESKPVYTVALNDGSQILALDANGRLIGLADEVSAENRLLIEAALQTRKVAVKPLPQKLQSKPHARMGSNTKPFAFALVQPVNKIIATTRPVFRWKALPGAESYQLKLFDENYNFVAESGLIKTNSWALPREKRLTRGRIYIWKVVAAGDAAQNTAADWAEAKFKVLERAKIHEINEAKKRHGEFHLLLGILYARAGMRDEAEREFVRLLKANPQSKVVQEMLDTVRSGRR
jgi:hypothetical protein